MKALSSSLLSSLFALCLSALTLHAVPVTVQELGVKAGEQVKIGTSGVTNNHWVMSGLLNLSVDGKSFDGFCIDPWQWSLSGAKPYETSILSQAPSNSGGMGALAAKQIRQLWEAYYDPSMSSANAAGLQLAIWYLVDQGVSNAGYSFSLLSGNDFGANGMLAWVGSHANAPQANLLALTSPCGQDYVIETPDVSATLGLLGAALAALAALRCRKA